MNETNFLNLITFWRNVEALSPQEIPKKAPKDWKEPVRDWGLDELPPWLDDEFKGRRIQSTHIWRHTVYAAIYNRSNLIERLEKHLDKQPDVYEERLTGQSCVFSLSVDENGQPLFETMMISMAAWACGIVESQGLLALGNHDACDIADLHAPIESVNLPPSQSGFSGFDAQLDGLREELAWRLGNMPDKTPIDSAWFADFVSLVIDKLKLNNLISAPFNHRVKSVQVRKPKQGEGKEKIDSKNTEKSEDDFLNSFFIKDLNRVLKDGIASAGKGMRSYLAPPANLKRFDVRKHREKALEILDPSNFPVGCWPAEHPLVWSQQVAINAMWMELQTGGCFAVNGPPGTGKTTLLRDVVAAIVVERAKVLATKGTSLLLGKRTIDIGNCNIPYYDLDAALAGHAIVVASSNNGAVENISLELPKQSAIHDIWLQQTDVYSDIAGALIKEPAWTMIAGRLGNKGNRNDFVSKFWWQKSDDAQNIAGLRERLEAIKSGKASPEIPWTEAVEQFNQAISAEQDWRQRVVRISQLPKIIANLKANWDNQAESRRLEHAALNATTDNIAYLGARIEEVAAAIKPLSRKLDTLRTTKPGLLEWISTLGKSHRQWRSDLRMAMLQLDDAEKQEQTLNRERSSAKTALSRIKAKIAAIEQALAGLERETQSAQSELADVRRLFGAYLPNLAASDSEQERSSPWAHPEWRTARIRVFLAAMNLHRAFVEENARKMMANLGIAMDMLQGGIPDPKVRVLALDSLALVCPVISTTFASVSSLFGELGPESIGWLLIDEAGQATPQAAAGAVWRAKRVVVVGDPLQLTPVVTVPRTIEASLAACHGNVGNHWHPSKTSAQELADQSTHIGTTIGSGDEAIWVGAPLRVHRRCDDPMFTISNEIAYDGLMVHQKKPSAVSWPDSAWIDVPKAESNGNWIPAECEALRGLLTDLLHTHRVPTRDIFLISPFRDVVRELRQIGKNIGLEDRRVGTVHTTQGKEAEVVIMVLGGGTAGARDWANKPPNLLNVAVSRAKARLYVIGDREDWAKRDNFGVMARKLLLHIWTASQGAV